MEITSRDSGLCIDGFKAYGVKEGRYGVALIVGEQVCDSAAVYTTSSVKGAHITVDQGKVDTGLQAVIVNSGNANAYIKEGVEDAEKMCEIAARELGIDKKHVGVASTGITGRKLDLDKIAELAEKAASKLTNSADGSRKAAEAIMTTDTKVKELCFEYKGLKVGGIGKGAGMIAPRLATMLCFLTTNADLRGEELQKALEKSVEDSFNMLVVDGDMSPNDTVLLMSNGKKTCSLDDFQYLLDHTTREMAKLMAKDGEGASKFLEVKVQGAKTRDDARTAAKAVISSSLVKTALYGENPNWGRILAAIGSRMEVDLEKLDLFFESGKQRAQVVEKGVGKDLKKAAEVLKNREIRVIVDLNEGDGKATAWGCDLTEDYVKINAGYN